MKSTIKNSRVVVAMSGGVDSSVAAALLKEKGYDVIGVTMQLWPDNGKPGGCCSLSAVEDARRVADQIGIPYYALNFKDIFKKAVIDDFIKEYNNGRTPNPCVRCNELVKFDALIKKAKQLGADHLATGHYARISKKNGRYVLMKGRDLSKDQSYFLYPLSQKALSMTMFPVGELTKKEVRGIAKKLGLKVADKEESQEICFVDGSLASFFDHKPGDVLDMKGNVIGKHKGYQLYTIGQRKGLGISRPEPSYVVRISPRTNNITVGSRNDAFGDELIARDVHWTSLSRPKEPVKVKASIRYRNPESEARIIEMQKGRVKVKFKTPQFAITPGQSIVFYDRDRVMGGGIIESGDPAYTIVSAGKQGIRKK